MPKRHYLSSSDGKLAMVEDGPFDLVTLAAGPLHGLGDVPDPGEEPERALCSTHGGRILDRPEDQRRRGGRGREVPQYGPSSPRSSMQYNLKEDFTPARPSLWPAFEKAVPGVAAFDQSLKYGIGRTTALGTKWEAYGTRPRRRDRQGAHRGAVDQHALAAAASAAKNTLASEGQ